MPTERLPEKPGNCRPENEGEVVQKAMRKVSGNKAGSLTREQPDRHPRGWQVSPRDLAQVFKTLQGFSIFVLWPTVLLPGCVPARISFLDTAQFP